MCCWQRRSQSVHQTLPGRLAVAGIIGNVVLVKVSFHLGKNFYENYRQFRYPPRMFTSSILGRKLLKNIGLKGHKISVIFGAPKRFVAGTDCRGSVLKATTYFLALCTYISYNGA